MILGNKSGQMIIYMQDEINDGRNDFQNFAFRYYLTLPA